MSLSMATDSCVLVRHIDLALDYVEILEQVLSKNVHTPHSTLVKTSIQSRMNRKLTSVSGCPESRPSPTVVTCRPWANHSPTGVTCPSMGKPYTDRCGGPTCASAIGVPLARSSSTDSTVRPVPRRSVVLEQSPRRPVRRFDRCLGDRWCLGKALVDLFTVRPMPRRSVVLGQSPRRPVTVRSIPRRSVILGQTPSSTSVDLDLPSVPGL